MKMTCLVLLSTLVSMNLIAAAGGVHVHTPSVGAEDHSKILQTVADAPKKEAATAKQPAKGGTAAKTTTSVITFTGLYASDATPGVQGPISNTYQPLMSASTATSTPDGGETGITINWENANSSNPGVNGAVRDHTSDVMSDNKVGGAVMFGTKPYSMTFDQPVDISSLYWTYYGPVGSGGTPGTISVYTASSDSTPAKTVTLSYPDAQGYFWYELTEFAGIAVTKIAFDPGTNSDGKGLPLNIDDIQVAKAAK